MDEDVTSFIYLRMQGEKNGEVDLKMDRSLFGHCNPPYSRIRSDI